MLINHPHAGQGEEVARVWEKNRTLYLANGLAYAPGPLRTRFRSAEWDKNKLQEVKQNAKEERRANGNEKCVEIEGPVRK